MKQNLKIDSVLNVQNKSLIEYSDLYANEQLICRFGYTFKEKYYYIAFQINVLNNCCAIYEIGSFSGSIDIESTFVKNVLENIAKSFKGFKFIISTSESTEHQKIIVKALESTMLFNTVSKFVSQASKHEIKLWLSNI